MKIKALVSFAGAFSMYKGEVKECSDNAMLQDLLKAGHIEEVKEETEQTTKTEPKKGVKFNGDK